MSKVGGPPGTADSVRRLPRRLAAALLVGGIESGAGAIERGGDEVAVDLVGDLDALVAEPAGHLGLDVKVGELLCVDWVSPHGPWDDLLNFIFDGGALSSSDIKGLRLVDSELRALEFCDEGHAKERRRW
jgi:hypothetical protein